MVRQRVSRLLAVGLIGAAASSTSAETPSGSGQTVTARIIDEGLKHGQVMVDAEWLSDHIGARLTNSPGIRTAEAWALTRFRALGLTDVRRQGFDFGRGWSFQTIHVDMVSPRPLQLHAIPLAWTPATKGVVTAAVVYAPMSDEADFAQWRGKLAGKWVLVDQPMLNGPAPREAPLRFTADDLAKMNTLPTPVVRGARPGWLSLLTRQAKLDAFLKTEGAAGMVRASYTPGQLVHGYGYQQDKGAALPGIELGAEDYGRLMRLAVSGGAEISVDSQTRFDDTDRQGYNIFADLPGTDLDAGYVMTGAHLDAMGWADGAADDGAGVAIVMEAARIIKSLGVKPRRTIRFALWSGKEQGLLGSKAYAQAFLARRPPAPAGTSTLDDFYAYPERFPVSKLPGYDKLAAYFGVDEGSGKVRGINAEGNLAAMPILKDMIAPFSTMGVTEVSPQRYDDSDHVFFAALGLPAFPLLQDPLDYEPYGHHSDADTFDHLDGKDMEQAAIVLASLLMQAADRPEPLPRMPFPKP